MVETQEIPKMVEIPVIETGWNSMIFFDNRNGSNSSNSSNGWKSANLSTAWNSNYF